MTVRGHMQNGVVVLDCPAEIPDGAEVEVHVVPSAEAPGPPPTLYERLRPFVGKLEGMPGDLAENHDHYLYDEPDP